jgi:peptide/nickel transport system substrate-binding protein
MIKRRTLIQSAAAAASLATTRLTPAFAQKGKDSIVIAMQLEPPGLDPTAGAASAIGEITLYNIFETLTKINGDGKVTPLLAESWEVSPDLKTYTFKLRKGIKFSNGEPFNAQAVKFSFDRAGGEKSTNKDKRTFANLATQVVDDHTVVLLNKEIDPDLPFLLGQATAVIVEPKSADTNATKPVGTGPYKLDSWNKGSSCVLSKWDGYKGAAQPKLRKVTFRFISDPAAAAAALMSGDVDAFPRCQTRIVNQFKGDPKFQVLLGGSRAKTIISFNSKHKPLDDVRVRRALLAAIDRKGFIEAAADGFGAPIGSHYVPGAEGFVDTTSYNPYNPGRAKQLLAEAGVKTPLELVMTLPPPPYARQGGEFVVAQLAQVGITVKVQNVEWAQWLANTYGGAHNYDLTIVSHVEPFDLGNYAKPDYYWGYSNPKFNQVYDKIKSTGNPKERAALLGEAQKILAQDAANGFMYQPVFPTIAKKDVKGLWKDMPISANDVASISWA